MNKTHKTINFSQYYGTVKSIIFSYVEGMHLLREILHFFMYNSYFL